MYDNFLGAYIAIVLAYFLLIAVPLLVGEVSQEDIANACRDYGKVAQVVPSAWEAIDGSVTVVCKDGTVHKVD